VYKNYGRGYTIKHLVLGNGESRAWFNPSEVKIKANDVVTWGCNAIYRDGAVDNLVSIDYGIQQEIYVSGYHKWSQCWFADWNILPASVVDGLLMTADFAEDFVHKSKKVTDQCVIAGADPKLRSEKIEAAILQFPNLDMKDLKLKMSKDVGVWITYVNEIRDVVIPVEGHVGYSTGNTALSLACQSGAEEVYMLGFDLSAYDKPLNNLYKGTDNYLPVSAKGFNPVNWIGQMSEVFDKYKDVTFYWVDCKVTGQSDWHGSSVKDYHSNVRFLTKDELCDTINIL